MDDSRFIAGLPNHSDVFQSRSFFGWRAILLPVQNAYRIPLPRMWYHQINGVFSPRRIHRFIEVSPFWSLCNPYLTDVGDLPTNVQMDDSRTNGKNDVKCPIRLRNCHDSIPLSWVENNRFHSNKKYQSNNPRIHLDLKKTKNMSQSFNVCPSGHYYASSLNNCPFCSPRGDSNRSNPNPDSTQVMGGDADRTQVMGGGSDDRTQVMYGSSPSSKGSNESFDDDKTIIQRPVTNKSAGDGSEPSAPANSSRKLVGWLVSFTHDPFGTDYRIFEGQNTIGRETSSTIRIIHDKSISSRHATLLVRGGSFFVKDELSANPSYVNDQEVPPGSTVQLKDGDRIRFGATDFLFRTAI